VARTWILTGSPENHEATRARIGKWPREHWTLAFQGQIRPVSENDAAVLLERLTAAGADPSRRPVVQTGMSA
jgi:hypothetical protein